MEDQSKDLIKEHFDTIRALYKQFRPERRVILYDIEDGKMYAFPYEDYKTTLKKRSQILLKNQYEDARKNKKIVVFVADSKEKTLKSFTINEK